MATNPRDRTRGLVNDSMNDTSPNLNVWPRLQVVKPHERRSIKQISSANSNSVFDDSTGCLTDSCEFHTRCDIEKELSLDNFPGSLLNCIIL